jgi:hypothetical protein
MATGTRRGTLIRRLSQPICNDNLWPNSVKAGGLIPIRIGGCLMALTTLPTLSFALSDEFPVCVEEPFVVAKGAVFGSVLASTFARILDELAEDLFLILAFFVTTSLLTLSLATFAASLLLGATCGSGLFFLGFR